MTALTLTTLAVALAVHLRARWVEVGHQIEQIL